MGLKESEKILGRRRLSRSVKVGELMMGGGRLPVIQSMNNTDTRDVQSSLKQITALAAAGCQITRLAVPDMQAAEALKEICARSPLPVVADIHFDYRLALAAIENGAAKIRINPGNIGGAERLREVALACKDRGIPIRVGVNSGSVERSILAKHGGVTAAALQESADAAVRLLEEQNFDDIVISMKASDPALSIACYRLLAQSSSYPLHLGVTEAGSVREGAIRSAVGIGTLLAEGIGDTFRVSLTADPLEEIKVAHSILSALQLREHGAKLISCPTCGRTEVNLQQLVETIEPLLEKVQQPISIALMGCAVNGPGEAREADIGLAGGKDGYLLFAKGETIAKISETEALPRLITELRERFGIEL